MEVAKQVGIFAYSEKAKLPIDMRVSHSYFPLHGLHIIDFGKSDQRASLIYSENSGFCP